MAYTKRAIRRSQIISTFGVGSTYVFKNLKSRKLDLDSLMLAGLDEWENIFTNSIIPKEWKINEPRLQKRLRKDFFLEPPDFREKIKDDELKNKTLPYLRFPRWHHCYTCGWMKKVGSFQDSEKCSPLTTNDGNLIHKTKFKNCANKKDWQKNYLSAIRFMVVCENGHVDDFPFIEWVHRKNNYIKGKCELKFFEGKGGGNSLMNLRVECVNCNEGYSLAEAFSRKDEDSNPFSKLKNKRGCSGLKPWLGPQQQDSGCKKNPKVVLKSASNVYYPVIVSSIFVPLDVQVFEKDIIDIIDQKDLWKLITQNISDNKFLETMADVIMLGKSFKKDVVIQTIKNHFEKISNLQKETPDEEEPYKYQEYSYILDEKNLNKENSELKIRKIPIEKYGNLNKYFSNILLIDSLVETKVQKGFTRVQPYDPNKKDCIQELSQDPNKIRWLPGTTVKGEGIFLNFDKKQLELWGNQFNFKYIDKILMNLQKRDRDMNKTIRHINRKYFLIHTFSHLLINQLSYSCGYGSSALRERIYCNTQDFPDNEMNGVLIYTASGDSEGSLGGLVREGEPNNLVNLINKALKKANVCSYDPVCLSHKLQGLNSTNASACHACSFLPETSCEESNQLLDRTTIIGDIGDKQNILKGYFQDLIED